MSSLADQRRIDIIIEAQNRTRKVFQQVKKDIDLIQKSGVSQVVQQANDAVSQVAKAASSVANQAQVGTINISNSISTLFSRLRRVAISSFAAIKNALSGLIGQFTMLAGSVGSVFMAWKSIKDFVTLDALKLGLTSVMRDAKAAKAEMQALLDISKKPGINYANALLTSTQFQAAGIDAKTSRKLIEGLGNALASVGGGAEDMRLMALAITQIATMGQVYGQEVRQLQQRLYQIRGILKEIYGTSRTETLQQRGVTSEDFISKLADKLLELPKVGDTVKNTMEIIEDSIFRLRAAMGEAFLPAIKDLSKYLQANEENLKAYFASGLRNVMGWIMENKQQMIDFVRYVYDAMVDIIANLRKFFNTFTGNANILNVLTGVAKAFVYLVRVITEFISLPVVRHLITFSAWISIILIATNKYISAMAKLSQFANQLGVVFKGLQLSGAGLIIYIRNIISMLSSMVIAIGTAIKSMYSMMATNGLLTASMQIVGDAALKMWLKIASPAAVIAIAAITAAVITYFGAIKPYLEAIKELEKSQRDLEDVVNKPRFSDKQIEKMKANPSKENYDKVEKDLKKLGRLLSNQYKLYDELKAAYDATPKISFRRRGKLKAEMDYVYKDIENTEKTIKATKALLDDIQKGLDDTEAAIKAAMEPLSRVEALDFLTRWSKESVDNIRNSFGDISDEYKAELGKFKTLLVEQAELVDEQLKDLEVKGKYSEIWYKTMDKLKSIQSEINAIDKEYVRIQEDIAKKAIKDRIDAMQELISVTEAQIRLTEANINLFSKYSNVGLEKLEDAKMKDMIKLVTQLGELANDPNTSKTDSLGAKVKQIEILGQAFDMFYGKYNRQITSINRQIDLVKSQGEIYAAIGNSQTAINNSVMQQIRLEKEKIDVYKEQLMYAEKLGHSIAADNLRTEINKTTADILKMQSSLRTNMENEFEKMTAQIINAPRNMTEVLARTGITMLTSRLKSFKSGYGNPLQPSFNQRPVVNVYIGGEKLKTDMYEVAEKATMDTLVRSGAFS